MIRTPGRAVIACIISLFIFPAGAWGEVYRSNEMGMVFEPISSIRTDEYPYYIRITTEEGSKTKTLFHKGEPIRRWVKTTTPEGRVEEVEYREGAIERAVLYDREQLPVEIRSYTGGELSGVLEYRYTGGRVSSVIRFDGEGNLIERRLYGHDSKGRLRGYREILPAGDSPEETDEADGQTSVRYLYSGGRIREEWHGDREGGDVFRYNDSGNLILHEGWRDGEVEVRLTRTYSESGKIVSSREMNFGESTVTLRRYDEGNLVRETAETAEGTRIEEITYTYGPAGNLVEKNRRAPGVRELWEYTYTGDELTRSVLRRSGRIVKITEYRNEDDYVETIYRNGEPLIAVEYADGKKVGEVPVR